MAMARKVLDILIRKKWNYFMNRLRTINKYQKNQDFVLFIPLVWLTSIDIYVCASVHGVGHLA